MSLSRPSLHRIVGKISALLLALVAGLAGLGRADPEVDSEYQTKAGQIYSFTKFIDWPPKKFPSAESPFVIGVYGADDITGFLREIGFSVALGQRGNRWPLRRS